MTKAHKPPAAPPVAENPLEEAVARALRDNLAPLQRAVEELQHAYGDLTAACASSRVANAIPAMLRAQAAAASLSAGLGVLTNFVTLALRPADRSSGGAQAAADMLAAAAAGIAPAAKPHREEIEEEELEAEEAAIEDEIAEGAPVEAGTQVAEAPAVESAAAAPAAVEETPAAPESQAPTAFDVTTLAPEVQEMHRRAKRVAKVAMQDIKMLRPKDVRAARENRDICIRLRDDLDKARKEYDRRFKALQDQPVDYFYDWLVAILADGDPEALGAYPYPSPVRR
ncbi:MAG: hypothetical protein WB995_19310 [Candidatus Acidiferrales bacterium]